MPKKTRGDYSIIGAAGEFQVAAEIAKRGAVATLTLKNTANIDVLASNPKKGTFANIQVKTRSMGNKQGWVLGHKVEQNTKAINHYYVFVWLKEQTLPEYYIIPFNEFATYVYKRHRAYLRRNDRHGHKHKKNNIRNFKPDSQDSLFAKKFLNRWDILKLF